MKGQFKVGHNLMVEVEAEASKDMFRKLAELHEVFGEKCCGLCDKSNLKYVVRKATTKKKKEVDYYELQCTDCGGKLTYGQSLDMKTIYPKRKLDKDGQAVGPGDDSGSYGKHNGWTKYKGPAKEEE